MIDGRYDFIFVRFSSPPNSREWASFAVDQIDDYGSSATFVGGKKSGWVRAPRNRAAIEEKIFLAHARSIQAGSNPHSNDPFDGWGICCAMLELNADLSRFIPPGRQELLADWVNTSIVALARISEVEYAFAYSGDFPKDGYFGRGILGAKPSPSLKSLFADSEGVAKWFRAKIWGTTNGFLFDAFMVNVLSNYFLASPGVPVVDFRSSLLKFGSIDTLTHSLNIWRIDTEEKRAAASSFLSANRLSVVSHEDNCLSQLRPK